MRLGVSERPCEATRTAPPDTAFYVPKTGAAGNAIAAGPVVAALSAKTGFNFSVHFDGTGGVRARSRSLAYPLVGEEGLPSLPRPGQEGLLPGVFVVVRATRGARYCTGPFH